MGLIGAVELVKDKATKESFGPEIGVWCNEACARHGVLLRACEGKRIAFCPPLIIETEEIDMLFDRLEQGLDDTLAHVRSEGLM